MKVEIEIKTNTVTFYPDKIRNIVKKVEEQQTITVSAEYNIPQNLDTAIR